MTMSEEAEASETIDHTLHKRNKLANLYCEISATQQHFEKRHTRLMMEMFAAGDGEQLSSEDFREAISRIESNMTRLEEQKEQVLAAWLMLGEDIECV